ncbi:alpha/beta hydrolase family protein [Nocardia sp. NPDC003482]
MPTPDPAILWQDHADAAAPVAIVLPAMGVRAKYYRPFADALVAEGFHSAVIELRGQGRTDPAPRRGTDHGFAELVTEDLPAALAAARDRFPASSLLLVGHSLGGHLAALYAAAATGARTRSTETSAAVAQAFSSVAGVVMIAADSPYHRVYGVRGPEILATTQFAAAVSRVLGYFPGDKLGGLGAQPRRLMLEWAHLARTGRYDIAGMPCAEDELGQVRLPVLAISVAGDRVAPPASVDHLVGKLGRAEVQRWHLTREAVDGANLNHVTWVKRSGPVAAQIASWWATKPAAAEGNSAER